MSTITRLRRQAMAELTRRVANLVMVVSRQTLARLTNELKAASAEVMAGSEEFIRAIHAYGARSQEALAARTATDVANTYATAVHDATQTALIAVIEIGKAAMFVYDNADELV